MSNEPHADTTAPDQLANEVLMEECYDALRRIAGGMFKGERAGHTLQPTALVNEVFLRLVGDDKCTFDDQAHFMRVASRAMKRLLIDHARIASAEKRGGRGKPASLPTMCALEPGQHTELVDVLALGEALDKLRALKPRHADMVELRVFAGLTIPQTAQVLGVSTTTIDKDWQLARAFLRREITG